MIPPPNGRTAAADWDLAKTPNSKLIPYSGTSWPWSGGKRRNHHRTYFFHSHPFCSADSGNSCNNRPAAETEAVEREEEESRLLARTPARRPVAKNEKSERGEQRESLYRTVASSLMMGGRRAAVRADWPPRDNDRKDGGGDYDDTTVAARRLPKPNRSSGQSAIEHPRCQ